MGGVNLFLLGGFNLLIFTVLRTYTMFRVLGLRHLTVVDSQFQVTGMVTRKDLMQENLVHKLM